MSSETNIEEELKIQLQGQSQTIKQISERNSKQISMFRPYTLRKEVINNQIRVHLLYVQVLKEFIESIINQRKKGQKIGFSSQQEVIRFYEAICFYYNQSSINYINSLKKKKSSSDANKPFALKYEQFCSTVEEPSELLLPDLQFQSFSSHHLDSKIKIHTFSQDIHSNLFDKQSSTELKISPESSSCPSLTIPPLIDQDELNSSNSESQSDPLYDYAERAQKQVNCIAFGNYSPASIKRKSKEQKLFIYLQDSFIKFSDSGRDAFYENVSFQLKKIEKSQVPLQY